MFDTHTICVILAVGVLVASIYYVLIQKDAKESYGYGPKANHRLCDLQAHMVARSPYLSGLPYKQKKAIAYKNCMKHINVMPSAYITA